ncbi:hypothetical protein [Emticicia oligotrophica]|uniref:hypothetical protein n=1 Tax=Emticicia oligotrophica TaxID=312279 RepID=UPI00059FB0A4|nr:hypothetical protein [Emticicia oligotrophica]
MQKLSFLLLPSTSLRQQQESLFERSSTVGERSSTVGVQSSTVGERSRTKPRNCYFPTKSRTLY